MGSSNAAQAAAFRSERIFTAPPLQKWFQGRAVLVGDAAHAVPINLAQGAAAAIEGAFLLGEALATTEHSTLEGDVALDGLLAACQAYQAAHEPRVNQCRMLTHFTAALSAPASVATEAMRNSMRLVPQPLNSWIFDTALDLSLGELPQGTKARWLLPQQPPVGSSALPR